MVQSVGELRHVFSHVTHDMQVGHSCVYQPVFDSREIVISYSVTISGSLTCCSRFQVVHACLEDCGSKEEEVVGGNDDQTWEWVRFLYSSVLRNSIANQDVISQCT